MGYIEFDRAEYMYSDFDERTLEIIERLLGFEVRDALFVPKVVEDVRPVSGDIRYAN